jgi:hypothetical protein
MLAVLLVEQRATGKERQVGSSVAETKAVLLIDIRAE